MEKNQEKIYLDYAATTPVDPEVFEAMKPYFNEKFGNASSLHSFGVEAQMAVAEARRQTAEFLNCQEDEIVFNSGATEGNNTIIKGFGMSKKLAEKIGGKPHIIVSSIEHECVLSSAKFLQENGWAEVSFLPVDREGIIQLEDLEKNIKSNTVLVSIMYANNEVGVIQPIKEISGLLKKTNQGRNNKIYFHTDAVQAINYLNCAVDDLGVDFLTLSAHKIYGPKGVGALYIRRGSFFEKFMHGGDQEFMMRSGTHNTPGIVGLGAALGTVKKNEKENAKIQELRDELAEGIFKRISGAYLNGSQEKRLPNNVNLRLEGVEGEAILTHLDFAGIAASTGSACAAKSLEPSHVLIALGLKHLDAHSSIRFSLGRQTKKEDVEKVLVILPEIIEKLRGISGSLGSDLVERGNLVVKFGC